MLLSSPPFSHHRRRQPRGIVGLVSETGFPNNQVLPAQSNPVVYTTTVVASFSNNGLPQVRLGP
jgi:hypothetical protein